MRLSHRLAWMYLVPMILTLSGNARADQCATALTATGRNELLQVSESDRRAYFYHQVCKGEATNANVTFEYVKAALGLSYSNQQQYCETEKSQWESYQFDYLKTSTVVEKALDSWLACIRLTRSGILLTPKVEPTRLVLTLERASRAKGLIRGISATAGTVCKGHLPKKEGPGTESQTLTDSISYQIPVDEAWTVICDRTGTASTIQPGATFYPATTVTLDTTEGGFSITLDQSPLGSEQWANTVASEISSIRATIANHESLLASLQANKISDVRLAAYSEIGFHYVNQWVECPEGWVLYRVGTGAQTMAGEIRGSCRQLQATKP